MKKTTRNEIKLDDAPAVLANALLTPDEAAKALRIAKRTLLDNVRRNKIPCVKLNDRVFRFHIPSVIAALQ